MKKDQKQKIDEKKHLEILEILQKSKDLKPGKQLVINIDGGDLREVDELRQLIQEKIDDPSEKYELYYNGIQKILQKYLPKGKEFKEERQFIYDEKNVFLNRGKAKNKEGKRGSDGRMTYNQDMHEMVELIANWVMTSQDPIDLYKAIYDLNDKYDYGHQDYDDSSKSFHKAMQKISKVPKP